MRSNLGPATKAAIGQIVVKFADTATEANELHDALTSLAEIARNESAPGPAESHQDLPGGPC